MSDDYIEEKRMIRENEYSANVHRLHERVYGLSTPIWGFITEDGKYSGDAVSGFIDDVLGIYKDNEFLRSCLYLRIRSATTGFVPFYISDEGEPREIVNFNYTVCERGKEKEKRLDSLCISCRTAVGFLYRDLFDDHDPEIVKFIAGEPDDPYDIDLLGDDYDGDADFRYMAAYADDHPEEMDRQQREFDEAWKEQEEYYANLSDEELEEMKQLEEEQQSPDYWDNKMKERAEEDLKHYTAQKNHLLKAFPDKDEFRKNIGTYYRISSRLEKDLSLSSEVWEGHIIESCLKRYLSTTTYSIFADRSSVVKVDAQLIHARTIAGRAKRDGE